MMHLTWQQTLRRIVPVTALSVVLVLALVLVMNRSTVAQADPQPEQPQAGLQIDMLGPDTTLAGKTLTFTILVTNATGQVLQNVVITDSWYPVTPTYQHFHYYSGTYQIVGLPLLSTTFVPTPTQGQPYMRWDLGTLSPGAIGSIVMTTYVTSTAQPSTTKSAVGQPTILSNVAVVETNSPGVPSANDRVNPLVVGPVMYLDKVYTPTLPRPGRLVTFTLKLVNRPVSERADSITSTNTIVTEVLPAKTTLWSVLPQAGQTYTYLESARLITFQLTGGAAPGTTTNFTFTVRLSPTLKNAAEVNAIRNNRTYFGFRSDEVTIPRLGEADVVLVGNDVIEKSVQVGPPPPAAANPARTYPNRFITYTIGIYNPLTETLSGLRVTDTLPWYVVGGPYFIYSDTVAYPGFAAPTVISVAGRTVAWNLPDIEAWGVYSFSLRALVPPNFDTNGAAGRSVDNSIYATQLPSMPVVYDNFTPLEARVTVVPQIVPVKSISPGPVFSGYPETYTLWLTNTGTTTITNIIVTDTLPTDNYGNRWAYDHMVFGPEPHVVTAIPPQVVWQGITIPAGAGVRLQFQVQAYGIPPPSGPNYCNKVEATTPDTFIPTISGLACMQFLNPFRINKTAYAPNSNSVVLGEAFYYVISLYNVSLQNYAITQISDRLPENFHLPGGGALYQVDYAPAASFPAGGQLATTFDVLAAAVTQNTCNKLPANIEQAALAVDFTLQEPPQTWYNASPLGPIKVYPHIMLANYTSLPGASDGENITYTIVLTNNTSNTYTNLRVEDTLPSGQYGQVLYAHMAPGSTIAEPQINGQQLTWTGLDLPPNGVLQFTFIAVADLYGQTPAEGLENKIAVYDDNDLNTCIPWLGSGTGFVNAKPGAKVNLRFKKIEYTKTVCASPCKTPPLGQVQYNVNLNNKGPYPVYNLIVTDLLPSSIAQPYWRWASNVSLPSGVTQISTDPPAWRIDVLNTTTPINFSFKARATIYPGRDYKNYMEGSAPNWTLGPSASHVGAEVEIVPGAALDKVSSVKSAFAGDRIVYTVTLYNQSNTTLTGLRITDTLPTGFTYDGMFAPTYPLPDTTNPLVWASKLPASVLNTQRLELVFYVKITTTLASGTYYNRVAASGANILIPSTDDTAPVKVKGAPNVSASKSANPASTYRGGTTAYTITLTNEDEDPLTVRVTDTLPAGLTFVAPLGDTPLPDQVSPVVWSNITLAGNASRQIGFLAYIALDAPIGTVTNKADVSSGALRFAGTGDTAPIYIAPQPEYDLQVSKVSDPILTTLGNRALYTITYRNMSDDGVNVSNYTLNDIFPAGGVTYIDGSGWTEAAPGSYVLNVGDVAANASGVVTLLLQIEPSFVGDHVQNSVTVTGTPSLNAVEIDPANNTGTAITFIGAPPTVAIAKTASPGLVFAGEPLMYALTLTNQSGAPLTMRVTDTLPAGFVFSSTVGQTPQPVSTSPLVWDNLTLPAGQSLSLVWYVLVASDVQPGYYGNDVALDANGLPLPGAGGLAVVETDIRRYYDLRLTKSDDVVRAVPGSIVTYTLRYTNTTANVTLTQVSLTDIFSPNGYLTFLGAGWNLAAPGVYTRTLNDLAPGASGSLLVPIQIESSLPNTYLSVTNTAIINAVPVLRATETNPGNNISTDIDIVHGPDIVVTGMSYSPANLRQFGTLTLTVTYKNQGLDATLGPDGKGWFGTDVYLKPIGSAPPSGPADHTNGTCLSPTGFCKYVQAYNGTGLSAGQEFTLTYNLTLQRGGWQVLYAQADPYWNVPGSGTLYGTPANGRIVEGDELNNISGPIEVYVQPGLYLPILRRSP